MYYKNQFEKIGSTEEGNSGVVIWKKIDGEEAGSEWFVKNARKITTSIGQILSQKIYKYYLGDNGPISILVENDNYDGAESRFYIASKKIDNYYSLSNLTDDPFKDYADKYEKCTGTNIKNNNIDDFMRRYIENGFGHSLPDCSNSEIKNIKDNKVAFCNDDGCFKPIKGIAFIGVLLRHLFPDYDHKIYNFGIVENPEHFTLSTVDGDGNFHKILQLQDKTIKFDQLQTHYKMIWLFYEHFAQELKLGIVNSYKILANTNLEVYNKFIDEMIKELDSVDIAVNKQDCYDKFPPSYYHNYCDQYNIISYDKARVDLRKFFEVRTSAIKELADLTEYFGADILNFDYIVIPVDINMDN